MSRVRFDHHRAAGCQRRGRVAARDRKGEREVGRAEHGDRAQRNVPLPQIGARHRLAIGHRRVDPRLDPTTFAHHLGEQTKLTDGAAALALDPAAGQAAFGTGTHDQLVAERHQLVGDGLQEVRAILEADLAIAVERGFGQFAGACHVGGAATGEGGFDRLAGAGIDAVDRRFFAADSLAADEHVAGDHHLTPSCRVARLGRVRAHGLAHAVLLRLSQRADRRASPNRSARDGALSPAGPSTAKPAPISPR